MLSCSLNTFLYVRIASITNVTIMANGKCIGILHNSCTDDNIETNPTKMIMKIAMLHKEIPLLQIWFISLYAILSFIFILFFGDIFFLFNYCFMIVMEVHRVNDTRSRSLSCKKLGVTLVFTELLEGIDTFSVK